MSLGAGHRGGHGAIFTRKIIIILHLCGGGLQIEDCIFATNFLEVLDYEDLICREILLVGGGCRTVAGNNSVTSEPVNNDDVSAELIMSHKRAHN